MTAFPWQRAALVDMMGVRPDGRWAASRVGIAATRQNGKNGALEIYELWVTSQLGMRVIHSAHEVKTARKAFKRLLDFFDNPMLYPELAALVKEIRRTNGQEAIELHNGAGVEFVARTKSSGRGFSGDVLVLDEAQELTEDEIEAMQPIVSASANSQIILTGTAPKAEKPAPVWRRYRALGAAGIDPRLCWIEHSADPDSDPAERSTWAQANPGAPESIGWDTIADEFASMSLDGFAAERLGIWSTREASAGLDMARWRTLVASSDRATPVFGLDVDTDRRACIGVAWQRGGGGAQVSLSPDHLDVPAHEAAAACKALTDRWGGKVWLGGAAAGLAADFDREHVPYALVKAGQFPAACGLLVDAIDAGTVHHFGQQELDESMGGVVWRSRGTAGEREIDLTRSVNVGPAAAVTRALFGLLTEGAASVYESRGALVF